jgi:glutaredoxin
MMIVRDEAMKYFILFVSIWLIAGPVSAEIYKWTDEKGYVHYSDKKPENQEVTELKFKIASYDTVSYGTVSHDTERANSNKADTKKNVVIYSASWCGVCKKAKTYFRRNGIPFTEYDIEKGTRAKRMYKKLGATGVPVIIVGRKRMNGFSEAGFNRIYR